MPVLKGKSFPNGEVRFSLFTPSLKPVSLESQSETDEQDVSGSVPNLTLGANSDRHNTDVTDTSIPRVGYGASGPSREFSSNGRRKILRAGGAIDRVTESPEDSLFLTGTLPGSTEEAKVAIAEWSAYAVNLVQSWLGKRIPNKLLIYAWEFQKRGALHLHLTVVCCDRQVQAEILASWKQQWTRIIDDISLKSGVDCWRKNQSFTYADEHKASLQTDAKICTRSVAAYLSKYLSKQNLRSEAKYERQYGPSRLWGISRPLCALLDSMTEEFAIEISNPNEAQAGYEDILSVLASGDGPSYNWRARVGSALAAVGYYQKEEQETIWAQLKNTLTGLARYSFTQSATMTTQVLLSGRTLYSLCCIPSIWLNLDEQLKQELRCLSVFLQGSALLVSQDSVKILMMAQRLLNGISSFVRRSNLPVPVKQLLSRCENLLLSDFNHYEFQAKAS
jgi:hypothetical protein